MKTLSANAGQVQSRLVHQPGYGACPDTRRSNKPYATTISRRSVFPESMRPPKPNSVEPPWYGTRMPGGVGGVASRGVPYPDQSPYESDSRAIGIIGSIGLAPFHRLWPGVVAIASEGDARPHPALTDMAQASADERATSTLDGVLPGRSTTATGRERSVS